MTQLEIIADIIETIRSECHRPEDYENYVENRLLYDVRSMAEYYGQTVDQIRYLTRRALLQV